MNPPSSEIDSVVEEEWQFITKGWWRTSYGSVPWSYQPKQSSTRLYALPPHYHGTLYCGSNNASSTFDSKTERREQWCELAISDEESLSLNSDLVGVCVAMEALIPYENAVGIVLEDAEGLILDESYISSVVEGIEHGLVGGMNTNTIESKESERLTESADDLYSSGALQSATSSVDSTDSERSTDFFTVPVTPKARISYAEVVVKNVSPSNSISSVELHSALTSPSKPLNAAASTFVPSFTAWPQAGPNSSHATPARYSPTNNDLFSPQAVPQSLAFPSLESPSTSEIKFNVDDQGFFTEVHVEPTHKITPLQDSGRASSALLPPFLQEPAHRRRIRTSRTRLIVDRLRSRSRANSGQESLAPDLNMNLSIPHSFGQDLSSQDLPRMQAHMGVSEYGGDQDSEMSTPSLEDDEEGWIHMTEPSLMQSAAKARRTRDLFLALRRRTDSLSSDSVKSVLGSGTPRNSTYSEVSLPATPPNDSCVLPSMEDGWKSSSTSPMIDRSFTQSPASIRPEMVIDKQFPSISQGTTPPFSFSASHFPFPLSPLSPHAMPYYFTNYSAMPLPYSTILPGSFTLGVSSPVAPGRSPLFGIGLDVPAKASSTMPPRRAAQNAAQNFSALRTRHTVS